MYFLLSAAIDLIGEKESDAKLNALVKCSNGL